MSAALSTGLRFSVPADLDDALALLSREPGSLLACGATVVLPRLAHDHRPPPVIDIAALPGFGDIDTQGDGGVRLGPAVTYRALLRDRHPALALLRGLAARITGGPQIRGQGTIGGSACHANPSSDVPTGLVGLDAQLELATASGRRSVPAAEFFRGAYRTALTPGEMLVGISVAPRAARWGYAKLLTASGGWPITNAAARLEGPRVTLTVGAALERPVTLPPIVLDEPAAPTAADRDAVRTALESAVADTGIGWWSDAQAEAGYRRRVAAAIAIRAVRDALLPDVSPPASETEPTR